MMMSDDKVGGWVKKGQNHDDVILECPPTEVQTYAGGIKFWPSMLLWTNHKTADQLKCQTRMLFVEKSVCGRNFIVWLHAWMPHYLGKKI